ncbi:MAG: ABC transporter substrate-binding protein [Betaproteobacteria bacterium]|nr:MAG: ABC transporter substrate-binding protein [Betaproteobacteria bacterium]
MKPRRRFLAGALALAAARVAAQEKPASKLYRIGMLESVPISAASINLGEFHRGMKELGHEEGRTYLVLYRSSEGRAERFAPLATELARQGVDVFLARGTPATIAARDTESGIPVVASAVADPLEAKLAASLEKPGGLVTGLTSQANELGAKRMELLKALAPGIKRLGALVNADNPASLAIWKAIEAAAPELKLSVEMLDVRQPEELEGRLDAAAKAGVDSLIIGVEALAQAMVNQVVDFTLRQRLPSAFASRSFVEAGGLLSYGVYYPNLYYRAASYVDRIQKGAKPGELPIERPLKFELVINRKTARALKITIPPDLFLRTDEIID